ncbi:MAG: YeaH/YhbH family protein [Candidatus Endonucleobacter sp. (ex Gigantidas childressi)]|nr:YeaH/YhbH family protein [Candidatus Endonucleobacter sp. (ex Gigantidas childressi)]
MSLVIDRRLNSKNKSSVNRQRFLRRYHSHVKEAVQEAVNDRSITDIDNGSSVHIPKKNLSEPFFHYAEGGKHDRIYPGNKEFMPGDRIQRPLGGDSQNGDNGSDGDSSADEFVFQINRDEFLEYLFNDLELPNLVSKELKSNTEFKLQRAGFTSAGSPDRLNVVRSLRASHARRIAISGKERKKVRALKRELREMEVGHSELNQHREKAIRVEIKTLNAKLRKLPFLDEFDLKYNNLIRVPQSSDHAVMFCVMDVSGSMTREIKDTAKRFFLILYLFLERNYEAVEVVFIRHHSEARECNEHDFFYARETGGTIVSTALELTDKVIKKRYPASEWNIYVAQASDGDNWESDSSACRDIIINKILPSTQYYSYVEITDRQHQNLWHEYKAIEKENPGHFAMQKIRNNSDIYPVFRRLFEKKEAQNAYKA